MKYRNFLKSQSGFTLIEVMVVVVILAILAAIIVPKVMNRPDQAKLVAAKQDILAIDNAMSLYKLDNGFYPTAEQGIQALITKPTTDPIPQNYPAGGYLRNLPVDPWGHAYHYDNPGKQGEIDIYSYGPTNQPSGTGINATIGNWSVSNHAAEQ